MNAPVFAYYRRPLVRNRIQAVETWISDIAARYGCDDLTGRTFVEFESPIRLLWSLGEFLDQRIDANIAEQVRDLARDHGYDYDRMHSYPMPAPALWQLIGALESAGGGIVLIPSLHHLADLEVPETAILQHFSRNLNTRVVWIDPAVGTARQPCAENRPGPGGSLTGVLGEFRVSPFCAAVKMARFYCEECLTRSGLAVLADTIDELMLAIVGPAERRWSGNADMLDEQLVVRLIRPAESAVLVVEVAETREHGDAPLDSALRRICASGAMVRRQIPSVGGTLTRYEVPMPGSVSR
ncbi:hypothetical protein ACFWU5_27155 [Nocardia sp. NPDC058640]|uniref:hypothetical protein n=1 Tax=Nocardia sp. NPDC058640 TaxID=3346571 RepID=UPI003646E612